MQKIVLRNSQKITLKIVCGKENLISLLSIEIGKVCFNNSNIIYKKGKQKIITTHV